MAFEDLSQKCLPLEYTLSKEKITVAMEDNNSVTFHKKFNQLSLFGIAFSLSCSWVGISSTLGVGLSSGGPLLIIYGLIIVLFFTYMCALSLGQFAHLMPHSCGVSVWTFRLLREPQPTHTNTSDKSDKSIFSETKCISKECHMKIDESGLKLKFQKSLTVFTGLLNYFGSMFTSASICSSLSMSIIGIYNLLHQNYQFQRWHIFVTYQCINISLTFFNFWSTPLPTISQMGLYISLISFGLTLVISLVCRSNYSEIPWFSSQYIFTHFENNTGWKSKGMAFIIGLINPMWGFVGLDSATHMVDEMNITESRQVVPKVMKLTVLIGFITSFLYAIGMFFCITNKENVINAFFPIIEIYYQACHNKHLAVLLQSFCICTGYICGIACGTWQNRILWSFGKSFKTLYPSDSFYYPILVKIGTLNARFKSPIVAHLLSQFGVFVIGCIFIGSDTAFNAIITSCITLLLLSYSIPSLIYIFHSNKSELIRRLAVEEGIDEYEPSKYSIIPHISTTIWSIFCLIFLSFPYSLPVDASNMNYVSVVYGVVLVIILVCIAPFWLGSP